MPLLNQRISLEMEKAQQKKMNINKDKKHQKNGKVGGVWPHLHASG
jgi:hypothetical protein